jgi:hypothetical protein
MYRGSELAFRTQLVIPEQRELYDYWVACAGQRGIPARADIHPSHFPRLLPSVSLIDVERHPTRYRFRLAGTQLYAVFDREVTGTYVDELDWGDRWDYWLSAYRRVVEAARPAQGIVRAPHRGKDHLVQFWLRLPLSDNGADVSMILSYDMFVSVTKASRILDARPAAAEPQRLSS